MRDFAFAGRCSTEDLQDPVASKNWQLTRANMLIAPLEGRVVAQYFDIGHSRSLPWRRRPRASALLDALADPNRGFDAVVIGEPQRVFYGNQYSLIHPVFAHYGVELWVPEVGGPVDPDSEAHDLIMSVYGGVSKAERSRIKVRVRSAMSAQASIEGRFLGGRPPYGYLIADGGPHPNPAKAVDGKRLHVLVVDSVAGPVVQRIFSEYLCGRGIYAIAEGLTRDGISSPSAHDRARNSHRDGAAWAKSAVRAILINPRYTGHQVWNKQRKEEVLLDVEDVALGYETKLKWNAEDKWVWSERIAHPPLVTRETFDRVHQIMFSRSRHNAPRDRVGAIHPYLLRGRVDCVLCERKMGSQWSHEEAYYRCRYPEEYALANKIGHPRNVLFREADVIPHLDRWLARSFAPGHRAATIHRLFTAQGTTTATGHQSAEVEARAEVTACDQQLARYREALNTADPGATAPITRWIAETEAERTRAEARLRTATSTRRTQALAEKQIADLVNQAGDIVDVLRAAKPETKRQTYAALGLRCRYNHAQRKMQVGIAPDLHSLANFVGQWVVSEGGLEPPRPIKGTSTSS